MRPVEEIKTDVNDCRNCKTDHDCMSVVSNCEKRWNVEHYENELLRALTANITLERLEELIKAEQEGRCVVLPAKNGDTVYAECSTGIPGEDDAVISWMLSQITMRNLEGTEYWAVGDDDGFAGEEMVFTDNDIGKTVFLTRAAAEAALAEKGPV